MVVFEVGFGEVAVQVRFADVVELAVDRPLGQREKAFDSLEFIGNSSTGYLCASYYRVSTENSLISII
jgi:hypothetical protein